MTSWNLKSHKLSKHRFTSHDECGQCHPSNSSCSFRKASARSHIVTKHEADGTRFKTAASVRFWRENCESFAYWIKASSHLRLFLKFAFFNYWGMFLPKSYRRQSNQLRILTDHNFLVPSQLCCECYLYLFHVSWTRSVNELLISLTSLTLNQTFRCLGNKAQFVIRLILA